MREASPEEVAAALALLQQALAGLGAGLGLRVFLGMLRVFSSVRSG